MTNLHGDTLCAYVAGIIDGEGSIDIYRVNAHREKPRYALRVCVGITNPWLPQFLKDVFGGSVYLTEHENPNHKDCWFWAVQAQKAVKVLLRITPYLQLKRPQAELALSFQSRKRKCSHLTDEQRVLEEADRILMKSYNKKGKGVLQ